MVRSALMTKLDVLDAVDAGDAEMVGWSTAATPGPARSSLPSDAGTRTVPAVTARAVTVLPKHRHRLLDRHP